MLFLAHAGRVKLLRSRRMQQRRLRSRGVPHRLKQVDADAEPICTTGVGLRLSRRWRSSSCSSAGTVPSCRGLPSGLSASSASPREPRTVKPATAFDPSSDGCPSVSADVAGTGRRPADGCVRSWLRCGPRRGLRRRSRSASGEQTPDDHGHRGGAQDAVESSQPATRDRWEVTGRSDTGMAIGQAGRVQGSRLSRLAGGGLPGRTRWHLARRGDE